MRITNRKGFFIAIAFTSLMAFGDAIKAQDSPASSAFRRLDKNGDGKLTIDEAPSADSFKNADTDQNGAVSAEEFRRFLSNRNRLEDARTPSKSEAPANTTTPKSIDGIPGLKQLPDCDAVKDAAGTGQLFECVHVPGISDMREGMNGIALADLNLDGRPDLIATYSPPATSRTTRLAVLLNRGGFEFKPHELQIGGSKWTMRDFGPAAQIPNLADFNGDGFLDILVGRSSTTSGGQNRSGIEAPGITFLLSDGAWDRFVDVSEKMGARNELGYNRQISIGDVNGDGWLDFAVGCDNIKNAHGGLPHSRLYVFRPNGTNFSDGKFEDIGGTDLVPDFGGFYHDSTKDKAGPGISLRDLDNDGDLDLLQSYHVDVRHPLLNYWPGEYRQGVMCWKNLLRETGELKFQKVTGNGLHCEARLNYNRDKQLFEPANDDRAPGLPYLSLADVDSDGFQDILGVGPDSDFWAPRIEHVTGRFWKNLGQFQFEERTKASGFDPLNFGYGQWMDFFEEPRPARWENWKPQGKYESQPGLPPKHPSKNTPYFADSIFADFDNDGALDVVVMNRSESTMTRSMLFMGKGDGTFEVKPTTFSGLDSSGISGEASDLNGDGLLDLVFAADPDNSLGPGQTVAPERYESKVYWNAGEHGSKQNHWLHLTFTGLKDAELIGARIELTADGKKQYRWIHSNHSYKSGGKLDAHFGLGKAKIADLTFTLLDGRKEEFKAIAADRPYRLQFGAKQ
jgi:hypothetical protein